MTHYTIDVKYQIGNTSNSEDDVVTIGLVWEDKDLARKALQSIKEHYTLYREYYSSSYRRSRTHAEIEADMKYREWYSDTDYDVLYSCYALMDDGEMREIPSSMWCGYFEKLYYARVVCVGEDLDSFNAEVL